MEQYGFICPGNPFDRIDLSGMQLPAGLRMSRDAIAAAADAADDDAAPPSARAGGEAGAEAEAGAARQRASAASASLVAALGWRNLREYQAVSAESAAACVSAARTCLLRQIDAHPTTWQQDVEALARLDAAAAEGGGAQVGGSGASLRAAAAVRYRLERKLLLAAGLEVLERVRV